jgi:hypothetical protein
MDYKLFRLLASGIPTLLTLLSYCCSPLDDPILQHLLVSERILFLAVGVSLIRKALLDFWLGSGGNIASQPGFCATLAKDVLDRKKSKRNKDAQLDLERLGIAISLVMNDSPWNRQGKLNVHEIPAVIQEERRRSWISEVDDEVVSEGIKSTVRDDAKSCVAAGSCGHKKCGRLSQAQ